MKTDMKTDIKNGVDFLKDCIIDNIIIPKVVKDRKVFNVELLNGMKRNKEYPTTFPIPSYEEKLKVGVGSILKVVDTKYGERFWVIVKEFILDELMIGVIDNELKSNQPYSKGDEIFIKYDNIIGVIEEW